MPENMEEWLKNFNAERRRDRQKYWDAMSPERKRKSIQERQFSKRMVRKIQNHIASCKQCKSFNHPCEKAMKYGMFMRGLGKYFRKNHKSAGRLTTVMIHGRMVPVTLNIPKTELVEAL